MFEFGRLRAGEIVLIHAGASGVGMAAIQLAKRAGATVLATASSDAKLERLKQYGLDHGINYRTSDFVGAVQGLTQGHGADLIVDSVGGRTLEGSIAAAAYRGRISYVGSAGRDAYVPNPDQLRPGNKTMTGIFLGAELVLNHQRVHAMIQRHLEDVARGALQDRHRPNVPARRSGGGACVHRKSAGVRARRADPVTGAEDLAAQAAATKNARDRVSRNRLVGQDVLGLFVEALCAAVDDAQIFSVSRWLAGEEGTDRSFDERRAASPTAATPVDGNEYVS